jgi:hypothetical protein
MAWYLCQKLELRESDVSPCEQYSLGEMARTKWNMKINKGQLLKK